MKNLVNALFKHFYRIVLMPYFERDRYFKELVDDVFENDIPNIMSGLNLKNK